jgi:hypothetical protein
MLVFIILTLTLKSKTTGSEGISHIHMSQRWRSDAIGSGIGKELK